MKKLLALILTFSVILAFAGCTNDTFAAPSTAPTTIPTSSTAPTGPYPDFEPTPVVCTAEDILRNALVYIQDRKPDRSKHNVDSFDVVNYNWFEDTFLLDSAADKELFDALGYGSSDLSVTIIRYTYEYQNKTTYEVSLSYAIPCGDSAQVLAYAKDDLHRFAAFRTTTQDKISYTISKQGTAGSTSRERLTDGDYQQLLSSSKISIATKDNSKKSGTVRFRVKAEDGNYCIDITVKT